MWWGRSEPAAQAWLGTDRFALAVPGEDVIVQNVPSLQDALTSLSAALKKPSVGRPIRLWLGSSLCTLTSVPAIAGVSRPGDAQAAALAWLRSQQQLADGWTASLAEFSPGVARWRVAMRPSALLDQVQQHLPVQSVRPWWSWALQRHEDQDKSLCAFDGTALVFCHWDGTSATTAETIGPVGDVAAAGRLLKRRAMQQPVAQRIALLDWATRDARARDDTVFAFAPWVQWRDAL